MNNASLFPRSSFTRTSPNVIIISKNRLQRLQLLRRLFEVVRSATDEKCSIWIGLVIRLGESVYGDGSNPRLNSSYVFLVCIPPSKRYIAQLNGDASQIFSILLTNHGKKGKHLCSKFATTEITTTTFLKPYNPLVLCIKDSHSIINVALKQNNF